jgi:DNA primase
MKPLLEQLKKQSLVDFISRKYGYNFRGHSKEKQLFTGDESHSCFVNTEEQTFHWFARGKGGSVVDFVMVQESVGLKEAIAIVVEFYEGVSIVKVPTKKVKAIEKTKVTPLLPGVVKATVEKLSTEGILYWEQRGIPYSVLQYASVGQIYRYNRDYFTFPVYSKDGDAVFFKMRMCPWSRVGDEPKGASFPAGNKPTLYGRQFITSTTKDIVICEGESDVLMCLKFDTVAISGTNGCGVWKDEWTKEIASYGSIKKVTLAYDRDEAGIEGEKKVAQSFAKYAKGISVEYYTWPEGYKGDLSDLLCNFSIV